MGWSPDHLSLDITIFSGIPDVGHDDSLHHRAPPRHVIGSALLNGRSNRWVEQVLSLWVLYANRMSLQPGWQAPQVNWLGSRQ